MLGTPNPPRLPGLHGTKRWQLQQVRLARLKHGSGLSPHEPRDAGRARPGRSLTFLPLSPGPSRSSRLRIPPRCLSRSSAASASSSSASSRSSRSRRRSSRAAASSASLRASAALKTAHTGTQGDPAALRDPPGRGPTCAGERGAGSSAPAGRSKRRRGRRRGWCSPTPAGSAPPAPAAPPPCAPTRGPSAATATSQRARPPATAPAEGHGREGSASAEREAGTDGGRRGERERGERFVPSARRRCAGAARSGRGAAGAGSELSARSTAGFMAL